MWIEPVATLRIVRTVNPKPVELPRPDVRQITVPDLVRVFRQDNARDFLFAVLTEEAEFHPLCVLREQREVHAHSVPACTERVRHARPNAKLLRSHEVCRFLHAGAGDGDAALREPHQAADYGAAL